MASLYAAQGCTNFLATRGATNDASTIVAYNADSGALYGSLYSYPAEKHPAGTMRQIFDWDTGTYLGEIPEAEETYNVIGNMNQFGLVIGETTYGGIESLQAQPGAIMDYGSLIWVTLQRAKTAREAIYTLDYLMQTYGYASEGESFSIADGKETWIMELIGKGALSKAPNKLGSVWVARKIPDGYVCAHANQARITTFPKNDKSDTLFAADVISFAREIGLYSGSDDDFSFSDVYDPVTFGGARFCEGRVWAMFGQVMEKGWMDQYLDYALGHNLTNRMPLWVMPKSKVSTTDVMEIFRDHFQGTNLDMSGQMLKDIGAANAKIPYRAHPLTWNSGGKGYVNERPVGTQQTGWNYVATTRSWMPEPLRGVLWFGVDDSATTARIPVYGSATRAPSEFAGKGAQDGVVTPMLKFDMRSAFYAFNVVANWVYTRWDLMYPDLHAAIVEVENELHLKLTEMDEYAVEVLESKGEEQCVEELTKFSDKLGRKLIDTWNTLFGDLFVKFRDGYVVTPNVDELACQCDVANVGYPQQWYDDIVASTGDHLLNLDDEVKATNQKPGLKPVSKIDLLNRR
jgi:dipeptidase